jgi:hypothetical protein
MKRVNKLNVYTLLYEMHTFVRGYLSLGVSDENHICVNRQECRCEAMIIKNKIFREHFYEAGRCTLHRFFVEL